ncbi:MAG: hypothetical protein ACOC44_04010 [Promethearchaeia archaeon]
MKYRTPLIILLLTALILFPQLTTGISLKTQEEKDWEYTMPSFLPPSFNISAGYNATPGFLERKSVYLNSSRFGNGLNAQSSRIYVGDEINHETIENAIPELWDIEAMPDFKWSSIVRILYLNINESKLKEEHLDRISRALGHSKYWFTESTQWNTEIIYTENHQILCHSAEYLIGQLFPNATFPYSGMTGQDHIEHAKFLINRWLDRRAQFGFSEWNSNSYLPVDITALANLIEFALDEEIAKKAAMILDTIAFTFANNYFKNRFATSMGRCYDDSRIGGSRDGTEEAAWLLLGIGEHNPCNTDDRAAVALATGDHYVPPPILEDIAHNASQYYEHRERQSIGMDDGEKYGIEYNEEEMPFWWGMSAPMAPQTIETSFSMLDNYAIDPMVLLGPQVLVDFLKYSAILHGKPLGEYSEDLSLLTRGVCLETANIYTYRTPYYQLSGAQDHMKGMNGFQEHIWQASLSDDAYVFTNSPSGITKNFDQNWMGGWKPRAVFYKNMGIIQYDRELMPLEGEILISVLNAFLGMKFYQHAFFPRSAFDSIQQKNGWTFGKKGGSYIALYSLKPTNWESDYELRVNSKKNVWIVELGSEAEYESFDTFVSDILNSDLDIKPEKIGYDVKYISPSQGKATVDWNGNFQVDGEKVQIENYPRFANKFCSQKFGTKETSIEYGNQSLKLDFNDVSRNYTLNN